MPSVEQYQQECFFKWQEQKHANECLEQCHDRNGNEIRIGNYVRAVYGEPRLKNIEGIVTELFSYEEAGYRMKLVSIGGIMIADYMNPIFFEVVME